jgi:hypothetical protein
MRPPDSCIKRPPPTAGDASSGPPVNIRDVSSDAPLATYYEASISSAAPGNNASGIPLATGNDAGKPKCFSCNMYYHECKKVGPFPFTFTTYFFFPVLTRRKYSSVLSSTTAWLRPATWIYASQANASATWFVSTSAVLITYQLLSSELTSIYLMGWVGLERRTTEDRIWIPRWSSRAPLGDGVRYLPDRFRSGYLIRRLI